MPHAGGLQTVPKDPKSQISHFSAYFSQLRRVVTVNAGANATLTHGGALTFSSTTGSGSITSSAANSNNTLNLGNASGFTGSLNLTCNGNGAGVGNVQVQFSSLGDGAGSALTLTGTSGDSGQNASVALAGDAGPLTFNNRQVQIVVPSAGGGLANAMLANNNTNPANTWVINTNLLNNSTRGGVGQYGYGGSYYQEFVLRGSNTGNNAFNGALGDGVSSTTTQTYVVKTDSGKWILGGANTFTGQMIVNQGTLSVSNINSATVAGPLGQGVVRLGGTTGAYSGGNFGGGTNGSTPVANWANIFTSISLVNSSFNPITPPVDGNFVVSGNTLTWTAVPEPTSALAGLLLGAGLLRRRRK